MLETKVINTEILSEYILERGGKMNHLKLQKLLYYVQAFHLAYFDHPLIEADFQAWLHGPVCRQVFDQFKERSLLHTEFTYVHTREGPRPQAMLSGSVLAEQVDLVNQVVDGYAKLTAAELEKLTHGDAPWIDARKGYADEDHCDALIEKEVMRVFYKKFIYGEKEE